MKEEPKIQLAKVELPRCIEALQKEETPLKEKLELLNKLVENSDESLKLEEIIPISTFVKSMRSLIIHKTKTIRTASLRVIRYYLNSEEFLKEMLKFNLHFFITRSLEKDKQGEAERLQALKLVRRISEINCTLLPYNIIHSLVSIAEYPEDNFCRAAVETLCELTIRFPKGAAQCGAIKVIINSILSPNFQGIQESLVLDLVFLLNEEETRKYLRPALDIGTLIAPLTDNFISKDQRAEKEQRWTASIKALVIMLKSWTGLICLTSHPLGLKSLVDALRLPCPELHDKILDALFDIFRLTVAKNSNPFKFSSQNQTTVEEPPSTDMVGLDLPSRTRGERHNLLNNYISSLLVAFIDCDLIDGLVELGSRRRNGQDEAKDETAISIKATLLLGELLYLTNTHLPASQCAKVQTLPILLEYAASFSLDPRLRSRASSMVTNLHQYHHLKHTSSFYDFHLALIVTGANKWKRQKGRDRRLDRMDEVKMKIDFAMDLEQLKSKIAETGVLTTKNPNNWKWDIVSDLLEGPLNNPALLTYAARAKFIKKILSFLKPSREAFSKMGWSSANLKYVRMACQLLEALASTDNGIEPLLESQLIPEIGDLLKLEVNSAGADGKGKEQRLLSSESVLKTMAREYFTMLGTLSSSPRGLDILHKFQIFKSLIELSELQGRDDLCHLIMTSLDYNMPGDSRVILSKALTSNSKVVRYLATRHMRVLLRAGVQDFYDWGVDFLVKQLADKDPKVAQLALSILDEACDDEDSMDTLIAKKPQLLTMGEAGRNLWLRFLSRDNGVRFLNEMNFIKDEMKLWKEKQYITYTVNLEAALAETFSPSLYKSRESDQNGDGVFLPPHFYGELAKTEEGCRMLKESNHVSDFIQCVKDHSRPVLERRASLWTLGHIGASSTGFRFLEQGTVLSDLIQLAETSLCLSIRGTCFYVLGMISGQKIGRAALNMLGWESPNNPNASISVPKDIRNSHFFKVSEYKYEGSFAASSQIEYPEPKDEIEKEILSAVALLSNFISAESASRTLKRLKAQYPEKFILPSLVFKIFKVLGTYKFRLTVRRFIYEIFDGTPINDLFDFLDKQNPDVK